MFIDLVKKRDKFNRGLKCSEEGVLVLKSGFLGLGVVTWAVWRGEGVWGSDFLAAGGSALGFAARRAV